MKIVPNPSFSGVDSAEIAKETSYMHFREGFDPSLKTLTERENTFDESIDVFATLDADEPKGVWSIQGDGNLALIRNLLWPGYTFVHTNSPVKYASFYYGTGQKNHNLGFMI